MMIAFVGMPSSGKSSTARALGNIIQAKSFLEPEEDEWPDLIMNRDLYGKFTALSWFRSARVPNLFDADRVRSSGAIAIVDSYYDVLVRHYLGTPPFAWLIPEDDPYFEVAKRMVELDYWTLPRPDAIVMLKLDERTWLKFMEARGREFDRSASLDRHFEMQHLIEEACHRTAIDLSTRVYTINQNWSSAEATALLVKSELGL